jgi:hypothetical protein
MFDNEPQDTPGECNCHLYLADNHGDNHVTIRCQLPMNHEGPHCEWFYRGDGKVTITWEKDERAAAETERERFEEWEAAGCPDDWD